jgi:hypothetical protein
VYYRVLGGGEKATETRSEGHRHHQNLKYFMKYLCIVKYKEHDGGSAKAPARRFDEGTPSEKRLEGHGY